MQQRGGFEIALAQEIPRRVEARRTVFFQVDDNPLIRRAMQSETGQMGLTQGDAQSAAGVGFLDAAGQRALATYADAVGIGKIGAGERPGGKDQRIVGRQGLHRGDILLNQGLGDQIAPAADQLFPFLRDSFHRARVQVYVKVATHDSRAMDLLRALYHLAKRGGRDLAFDLSRGPVLSGGRGAESAPSEEKPYSARCFCGILALPGPFSRVA